MAATATNRKKEKEKKSFEEDLAVAEKLNPLYALLFLGRVKISTARSRLLLFLLHSFFLSLLLLLLLLLLLVMNAQSPHPQNRCPTKMFYCNRFSLLSPPTLTPPHPSFSFTHTHILPHHRHVRPFVVKSGSRKPRQAGILLILTYSSFWVSPRGIWEEGKRESRCMYTCTTEIRKKRNSATREKDTRPCF